MTWVWIVLAVWLVSAPLAVVVGRAIRIADREELGSPDRPPWWTVRHRPRDRRPDS